MAQRKKGIAFYPCCGGDFDAPASILARYAEKLIFCDTAPRFERRWRQEIAPKSNSSFLLGDVRERIKDIDQIDILFYRRDSNGEGGSGVYVLGDSFFPRILERFNPEGGLIITDGSNSRGSTFEKMLRPRGYNKYGWSIKQSEEQLFIEKHNLYTFSVRPDKS